MENNAADEMDRSEWGLYSYYRFKLGLQKIRKTRHNYFEYCDNNMNFNTFDVIKNVKKTNKHKKALRYRYRNNNQSNKYIVQPYFKPSHKTERAEDEKELCCASA